jgi:hypothetical protein
MLVGVGVWRGVRECVCGAALTRSGACVCCVLLARSGVLDASEFCRYWRMVQALHNAPAGWRG